MQQETYCSVYGMKSRDINLPKTHNHKCHFPAL